MKTLFKLLREEEGVTAIEYTLIAALVGIACLSLWLLAGPALQAVWQNVNNALTSAS